MTDVRRIELESTVLGLSWPITLDNIDYFDVKRVVINFSAPIEADENLVVTLRSGLGVAFDTVLERIPLIGASSIVIENVSALMRTDILLIEFTNTDAVTINGYATLERAKLYTSGINSARGVYLDGQPAAGTPVFATNLPIESNGAVPVNIQDQTSPLIDLYFAQELTPPKTLAVDVAVPTNQMTLTTVTGFVPGGYVGLFSGVSGESKYYFGTILSVSVNTLTMDTPISFEFEAGDPVANLNRNMNVNGATTAQIFSIWGGGTGSTLLIDITQVRLLMECATAVDLSLFGNLTALTNGLVLRRSDGVLTNYWNVKRNAEFDLHGIWRPYALLNPAQGIDGAQFTYRMAGPENHGVTIRLGANETLDLIVQDNLGGLVWFQGVIWGHEVTD